jgi:hypothetical protein
MNSMRTPSPWSHLLKMKLSLLCVLAGNGPFLPQLRLEEL